MNNAEWLSKHGIKLSSFYMYETTNHTYTIRNSDPNKQFGTVNADTPYSAIHEFMEWLDKRHVENILTAEEKAYLSVVIKPFRDRILSISKEEHYSDGGDAEHLWFAFNDDSEDEFSLPSFKAATAYRGMVLYHYYTLEDLGL